MYYMGCNDLFDHLLDSKKMPNGQAGTAEGVSPSGARSVEPFGRRKTDLQTRRPESEALRGELPSPRGNKNI